MYELAFRDATPADVDAVVALVTSAYRGDASRAGWTTEADLLDGDRIDGDVLRGDLARARSRVLLAEADGQLVACAHVAVEDTMGYFGMFAVRPELQGHGIGDRVLAECERIAAVDWGLPAMRMTVIDLRDDLIAWYERRGYRCTGIRKPFPYGDLRFGIPKRDDLRFEVLEKALTAPKTTASAPKPATTSTPTAVTAPAPATATEITIAAAAATATAAATMAATATAATTVDPTSGWIRVCATSELLPGETAVAWDRDTPILVLNLDGTLYALEDRCTHEDFELSAGAFDANEGSIECVLHGARFDIRDGRALCAPAYVPVVRFPVKVEDAAVWTRDDRD